MQRLPDNKTQDAGFDLIRAALVCVLLALIVAHEIWASAVKVDGPVLGLVGLIVIVVLLPSVEEFSIPGFGSVKLRQILRQADDAAERVAAANAFRGSATTGVDFASSGVADRLDLGGLAATLVDRQPLPAMLALKAEVEQKLTDVFRELYGESPGSALDSLVRLGRDGYLDEDQVQLGTLLLTSINIATHGARTAPATARSVVSLGTVFASSLERPELVSEAELHEAVAEALDSDPRLEVERHVRAGRRIADFRVRRGDRVWLVEVKAVRGVEHPRRIREGVEQLDELLRWFRLTKGVLVVPDETTLPRRHLVERPGDISILIKRASDLTEAFS